MELLIKVKEVYPELNYENEISFSIDSEYVVKDLLNALETEGMSRLSRKRVIRYVPDVKVIIESDYFRYFKKNGEWIETLRMPRLPRLSINYDRMLICSGGDSNLAACAVHQKYLMDAYMNSIYFNAPDKIDNRLRSTCEHMLELSEKIKN